MQYTVRTRGQHVDVAVANTPDTCPHCHCAIVPQFISGFLDDQQLFLFYNCVRNECSRFFIVEFFPDFRNMYHFERNVLGSPDSKQHPDVISQISPDFINIYSEAQTAQDAGLSQICGMGFRKALEFLIKDYLIRKKPEAEDDIKDLLLGKCIAKYIENSKIKDIASRAAWLGNDETHYVRKWAGMDVENLKQLIKLTTFWMEAEYLTDQMIEAMPR
jgi:hypothetical protein